MLTFGVLAGRAAYLQGLRNYFLQQKGDERYRRVLTHSADRGKITHRNGEPFAISTPVESVWASADDVDVTSPRLRELAKMLELKPNEIRDKLKNENRNFV